MVFRKKLYFRGLSYPRTTKLCCRLLSREPPSRFEWLLDPNIFLCISSKLFTPDVNLFTTRLNSQLARFASWKPDPEALFYDAFARSWDAFTPYIFQPFLLPGRVLGKLQSNKLQQAIGIARCWETRPWYPTLLSMLSQSYLCSRGTQIYAQDSSSCILSRTPLS